MIRKSHPSNYLVGDRAQVKAGNLDVQLGRVDVSADALAPLPAARLAELALLLRLARATRAASAIAAAKVAAEPWDVVDIWSNAGAGGEYAAPYLFDPVRILLGDLAANTTLRWPFRESRCNSG